MNYYGPWFGIAHVFGGIFSLIFWILLIGLLIRLIRGRGMCRRCGREWHSNALEILRERYAKGEIGKDEFERMRKELAE